MLTRPTTEQVLVGIANELRDTVAPEVRSEPVQVLLGQIDQILRGLAVRSAHEIAWMHEEADTIAAVTGTDVGWPASPPRASSSDSTCAPSSRPAPRSS